MQIIYSIILKIYILKILATGFNEQLGNKRRFVSDAKDHINQYFYTNVPELDITDKIAVTTFLESNRYSCELCSIHKC